MPLTDIKSILEVAIGREEEAYEFYANVAERMTNPAVKEIFGQLSQDELGHKMFLLAAQKDDQIVAKLPVPADYKVAEATELPALSIDMKPADAVALAMKKEQQSVELYRGSRRRRPTPRWPQCSRTWPAWSWATRRGSRLCSWTSATRRSSDMKPDVRAQILDLAATYPTPRAAVLSALQMVQEAEGGRLSADDLTEVAKLLDVPLGTVYATVSYYTMLNLKPVGTYHLQLDTNISAKLAGADDLLAHMEQALGISAGETTSDGLFTLSTVEDLGACGTCPVLQVNDRYYENMTAGKFDELLASLKQGVMPDWKTEGNWGTECNILLARRGKADSTALAGYVADGGYQALEKALTLSPAEIVQMVKDSGLRGRGGAGFPAGVKWGFLPKDSTKPVYLVCNADEGEPGTFKDRQIMEFDPHLLIEGMAVSGYAVGAKLGYIYIRGEFAWIADILERAIAEARSQQAGKQHPGSWRGVRHPRGAGAGAYVCGEETALIESLEGKRGNPRLRPPYPAVSGVFGCPTVVNNVETLACVPYIVLQGAEAFRQIGTPNNSGPKLFGVSGHVKNPGVYEFPMGVSLAKVLEAAGGVVGNLKAVIVGGLSTPILKAEECRDLTLDYDTCAAAGTALGSGGIIVMNDTVDIPEIALRTIEFYAHESCGQCTPCRQGSTTIKQMLRRWWGRAAGRLGQRPAVGKISSRETRQPHGRFSPCPRGHIKYKESSRASSLTRAPTSSSQ